jgi:hypothetical protein
MSILYAYAGSDLAKLEALPKPNGDVAIVPHPRSPDGHYNHAAGRNKQLNIALRHGYDWVALLDDDWVVEQLNESDLYPGCINRGFLSDYPDFPTPHRPASVFVVPRKFMDVRWPEELYPFSHWADVHWFTITCECIKIEPNEALRLRHIPHPRREDAAMLARGQAIFDKALAALRHGQC